MIPSTKSNNGALARVSAWAQALTLVWALVLGLALVWELAQVAVMAVSLLATAGFQRSEAVAPPGWRSRRLG